MSAPNLLRVDGLCKSFGPVQVLKDISLTVGAGEVLGIVGENGSGKSTTMNILAGVLAPDAGTMRITGEDYSPASRRAAERQGVGFIQQELNIFPNLSVAENLLLGRAPRFHAALPIISSQRRREEAQRWLAAVELEVEPELPAARLSAGQRQLLEIARALSSNASILIFDEPTTSLTAREISHLFTLIARLRAEGRAILFISHALDDVLALADRVLVLREGKVTLEGPSEKLTIAKLIAAMIGRNLSALFPERPTSKQDRKPLLEVQRLGEPRVLSDICFTLGSGEIVGLTGLMGSGRTELARIIFGLDGHRHGSLKLNGTALRSGDLAARLSSGMAFLTEDRRHEGLLMEASVSDNVALAAARRYTTFGFTNRNALANAIAAISKKLRLKSGPAGVTPVGTLSGGNQQKALLARWLLRAPKLLILDEPTRGVDIGAKQDIYRQIVKLAEQGAGILLICSEIEEAMGLADRILVLQRGRLAAEFSRGAFDREAILNAAFGQRKAA